jgi:hypothetical protein
VGIAHLPFMVFLITTEQIVRTEIYPRRVVSVKV